MPKTLSSIVSVNTLILAEFTPCRTPQTGQNLPNSLMPRPFATALSALFITIFNDHPSYCAAWISLALKESSETRDECRVIIETVSAVRSVILGVFNARKEKSEHCWENPCSRRRPLVAPWNTPGAEWNIGAKGGRDYQLLTLPSVGARLASSTSLRRNTGTAG